MLGQGGTPAWVEAALPAGGGRRAVGHRFAPAHAGGAGRGCVTLALGRDEAGVAPTSGTYRSGGTGRLTASKQVTLTDLG